MHSIKSLSLVLLSFLTVNSFAQIAKIDVKKGQKYQVVSSTKMTSFAEVMGQTMENTNDSKSTTEYEVKDVESSEIKLESVITQMKVTASAMGQTMEFDSDKKNNEGPLADALSKTVGKVKTTKLDGKGNVTKQDAPEEDAAMGMPMLGGNGNDAVIDLFVPALIGKDIKVGESYLSVNDIKGEKSTSHDSGYYKITAIDKGIVSVSYAGTQVMQAEIEQMGQSLIFNANNTVNTELQMELASGRILVKASVVQMTGTVDAASMSIPLTGKTTTTVTITQL